MIPTLTNGHEFCSTPTVEFSYAKTSTPTLSPNWFPCTSFDSDSRIL